MTFKVSEAVRLNYPEYYSRGIQRYPAAFCAPFCAANGPWGIFSNFGNTPLLVEGLTFRNSEQLFQMLKFTDAEALADLYSAAGRTIKMKAKKWMRAGAMRPDWGAMIADAMKFAISVKFGQCPAFRQALRDSAGLFIVEDQTTFPRKEADTWGAKLVGDLFVGPNLMGQLLMELREADAPLPYSLPDGALDAIRAFKSTL